VGTSPHSANRVRDEGSEVAAGAATLEEMNRLYRMRASVSCCAGDDRESAAPHCRHSRAARHTARSARKALWRSKILLTQ
jgi:hypothetical protein